MKKRFLASVLALCMVLTLLPISAQAVKTGSEDIGFRVSVTPSTVVPDGYIGIYTTADLINANWEDDSRYILMADLNMNETFATWEPISFRGTLDGNGHAIKNLRISAEVPGEHDSYYGLFSSLGGTVKNLALSDINIDISGDFSDYVYIGGLAGETAGFGATIENCYVSGRIGANTNLTSDIYRVDIGGLVGTISGSPTTLLSCANFSTISVDSPGTPEAVSVGGLIGSEGTWANTTTISKSINSGNITIEGNGHFHIGGIAGSVRDGEISCCKNTGGISANSESGTVDIGGIVGWAESSGSPRISQCGNSGEISGTGRASYGTYGGSGIGGVLGGNHYQSTPSIEDTYNCGDIFLEDTFRGLSGYASKAGGAGGILGQAQKIVNIKTSYNYGTITSNAASSDVMISNGGAVGFAKTSNIQNCYWRSDTADIIGLSRETSTVSESGTLSALNANNQTAYVGFDFESIWTMGTRDYMLPILKWEINNNPQPIDPILNSDNVFLKQAVGSKTCTLVTATMMVRRRAILDGISDWDSITEAAMKKVAWGDNGFIEGFTYRGITGGTESIRDKSTKEKKEYLISLLRQHPEGIGVYSWMSWSQRHAVLLTDYDAATDTFYCADPSKAARHGRIPLEQCSITWGGEGQAGVLGVLHRIYYVAKDVNRKTLVSSQINSHCPVDMVFSINGTTLDSRIITGTSTNGFTSMTVSEADDGKSIEVQITGDYLNNYDADVKLIGTDNGEMTFTIEHLYSDGSIERNIFEHVPVSKTFTAETAGCYPQSSVVLSISDSAEKNVWVANPNEIATKPYTNFDNINTDDDITSIITFDGVTTMTTNEDGRLSSLPAPTRSGYTFNGWYMADGTRITTNTVFTEDTTVYASWSKIDIPSNPSSNDSDSSDSDPTYSITVPSRITGGTVKVTPTSASERQRVTVTVKANPGYKLDKLTVTDSKGNELKLTDKGDGKYTFTMPDSKVTVDVSFAAIAEVPTAIVFTDVPSGAYYYDAVAWAVKKGVTSGASATMFSPDSNCTRAQIVTFLWRAAGSPVMGGNSPFTDVASGSYYYDAVQWAVAQGITAGTSATTFSPEAACTRGQAVTFLYRAAGSPVAGGSSAFVDVSDDAYHTNAVRWAVSKGVTAGTSTTTFSPDSNCTRAQIVSFLYRDRAN